MAILCLSDIFEKVGLDPKRVKLIRHVLSKEDIRRCYNANMLLEYTRLQKNGFSKGFDYWCVFIGGPKTSARLYGLYKVGGSVPSTPDAMPEGLPIPEAFTGTDSYYQLDHVDLLKEFENKLVIEWGNSAKSWCQKGTIEKPVLAIQAAEEIPFPGYEDVILEFNQLKDIVDDPIGYQNWHTALSAVKGVYLIVDKETGKQYVGSAYGTRGILGRWEEYVETHHGGNEKIIKLLTEHQDRYKSFQFSILRILPMTEKADDVINVEELYKKKLMSIKHGLNDN